MQQCEPGNILRKPGIEHLGDIPWGTHLCCFYQTKEDLIDILVPYFIAGLKNNEYCLWITSEPLNVADAKAALSHKFGNLNNYDRTGQIEFLTHQEWYLQYGTFNGEKVLESWINKVNQAIENGFAGIRICGNTSWLEKRYWRKFQEYEALVQKKIKGLKMIAMCTYQLDKCDVHEIFDIVSNHQFSFIHSSSGLKVTDCITRFNKNSLSARLAASVAHEIKNPITSINSLLQVLKVKDELKSFENYFDLMLKELQRINNLITEFLGFARQREANFRRQNINDILKQMYPLISADAIKELKKIELVLGETHSLYIDEKMVRQLIYNLVRNGLDAMEADGTLSIKTYSESDVTVLAIKDEGKGIPPNIIGKIGSPYFTTKENGNGLGLPVCYRIASQNNATVNFDTGPDGTVFYVRFSANCNNSALVG